MLQMFISVAFATILFTVWIRALKQKSPQNESHITLEMLMFLLSSDV